ncbi:MAG: hypothetical protein ACOZQL_29585 [Myxococcota bacterium]
MSELLRCERHGALAGWQCTVCHQPLCPDCAALKTIPPVTLVACGHCGEHAEALVRKKAEAQPLAQRVPGAFRFPLHGEGVAVWLGMALWLYATSFLGGAGILVGWSVAIGSFFGLTRSTARGHENIELSDFQDMFQGLFIPVALFALALLPVWGGLLVSMWLKADWLRWVALGLGLVWSPTAYIGAATNASPVHLLNPMRVLGVSGRLGKDFGVYVAVLVVVVVLMALSVPISWLIGKAWAPIIAGVAAQMVLLYAPLVGARIAGEVLKLHGHVFGMDEADIYEPILRDTQPRGSLPEKASTLPAHLPAAIELEPEAPPVITPLPATPRERFAALELNPAAEPPPAVAPLDVALLPSHGERAAHDIRRAMRAGQVEVALDGLRATGLSAAPSLTFDELLWLAQHAAAHIDYESSSRSVRPSSAPPPPTPSGARG